MSFSEFLAWIKRHDENAAVIFDRAEPIGQPTDLVMPRRRWFGRNRSQNSSPSHPRPAGAARS
jgi:hypothetical protein